MGVKSSKRAWADIIADILTNTRDGENVTDIMYNTRLSYAHMKEYLKMMVENGLLAYEIEGRGMYRTTERGFEYLETYKRIRRLAFPKEQSSTRRGAPSEAARMGREGNEDDPEQQQQQQQQRQQPVAPGIAKGKARSSYTSKP